MAFCARLVEGHVSRALCVRRTTAYLDTLSAARPQDERGVDGLAELATQGLEGQAHATQRRNERAGGVRVGRWARTGLYRGQGFGLLQLLLQLWHAGTQRRQLGLQPRDGFVARRFGSALWRASTAHTKKM